MMRHQSAGLVPDRHLLPLSRLLIASVLFCLTVQMGLFFSTAHAQTLTREREGRISVSERVSVEMYGGYLKGMSREIVYEDTGRKKSELLWVFDDAWVVGGTISYRPLDWLTLRVSGWTPVKSSNTMNDYDWLVNGRGDWSDLSHHSDTRINHAGMIDAGLKAQVASFKATKVFDRASIDLLAGFRWLNISWTAYGGSGVYSHSGGFRNETIVFPEGQAGLAYEQWYNMPYIGIGASMSKGRWTLGAEVTGTLWGWGSDKDNHYDRTLLFEEQYTNIAMIGTDVHLSYALSKNLDLVGRFVYTKYIECQGPTTMTNYSTGDIDHFPGNAAGMDHQSLLFNVGLRWKLF